MKSLTELKNFLTGKVGTVVNSLESNKIVFSVDHTKTSRKVIMTELMGYSGYKLSSTGSNTGVKQYTLTVS